MFKKLGYFVSLTFCLFALSACDSKTESEESKAADSIAIVNPTIRAMPPGQKVTAMYMQLKNSSATKHELVKVEGDISPTIELHSHIHENGVMKMGQVESMPVAANSTAEAKQGSYHVMIIGLTQDLNIGDTFKFNFIFKDGSNVPVTAEVKTIEVN